MRFIVVILIVVISSCNVLKPRDRMPKYVDDSTSTEQMIQHQTIPLVIDTTKTIIVYNVVEKDEHKLRITDETVRLLIADFFGTISTMITVWQLQNQQP